MKSTQLLISILFLIAVWQCKKEPAPAPTVTITANPGNVNYGNTATVTWSSTNASSVTIDGKSVATSGTLITPPLIANTTFNITATGGGGTANSSASTVINVAWLDLTVSSEKAHPGDTITVSCLAVSASGTTNNIGAPTSTAWTFPFIVTSTTTVTVTALGVNSATQSRTIIVPTAKDTLISSQWTFIQTYFSIDKIDWVEESYMDAYKGMIYHYCLVKRD